MIYLILGMHKSGTTLLAETLHKSGVNMIEEALDDDGNYKTGHKYERPSTNLLNKDILKTEDMFDFSACNNGLRINADQQQKMEKLIAHYQKLYQDWGFKDPRTVLTYGAWKKVLPEHKLIIVFRNPSQIMSHMMAGVRRPDRKIIRSIRALEAWKFYNKLLLQVIREQKNNRNCLVINYHDLMTEESIQTRLADFIGKEVEDARRMDSYNFREDSNILLKIQDTFARNKAGLIYGRLEKSKVHVG